MKYEIADKYRRMLRAYERLRVICTDNGNTIDNASPRDLAEAFFSQCYHLKDYIKKERPDAPDVEAYINKTGPLRIAADFCNSEKHAGLDRKPRAGEKISAILVHMKMDYLPGRFRASGRVEIRLGEKSYDALKLATDCVKGWDKYLKQACIEIPPV